MTSHTIASLFLLLALVFCLPTMSTAQYDSINHGAYHRTYLLHLPTGYNHVNKLPLVIALHGGFGNAYSMQHTSQLSAKADQSNFIVVYPEGLRGGLLNASSWNAGWCCGFASATAIDDVGFIHTLLDTLLQQYAIDSNQVYVTGISNGGFMSYRLACELSHKIAAIAPVAASMSIANCSPTRAIPIISFHSYLDSHIPYLGGIGNGPSNHYNLSQDSVFNIWTSLNACNISKDTVVNNAHYTLIQSSACACNATIQHYATQDGGHSWPGAATGTGDPSSSYLDATNLIWSFFQQHSLNCSHNTATITHESSNIQLYPNPTTGILQLQPNKGEEVLEITVFNAVGKHVALIKQALEIDLSHLNKGIYFIHIRTSKQIALQKIRIL